MLHKHFDSCLYLNLVITEVNVLSDGSQDIDEIEVPTDVDHHLQFRHQRLHLHPVCHVCNINVSGVQSLHFDAKVYILVST